MATLEAATQHIIQMGDEYSHSKSSKKSCDVSTSQSS